MRNSLPFAILVDVNTEAVEEIKQWCLENFGTRWDRIKNPQGLWTMHWNGNVLLRSAKLNSTWRFVNEKDAVLFALRWT